MYIGAQITRVPKLSMPLDNYDNIDTTLTLECSDNTPVLTDYTVIVPHLTGIVKWFNNKSGFGFITVCEEGDYKDKDIFVHYTSIRVANQQYKYLVQGEYVDFTLVKANSNTHEFQAMNVSGVKGGPIMCEIRRTTQVEPTVRANRESVDRPPRVPRKSQPIADTKPRKSTATNAEAEDLMGFTKVEKKRTYASVAQKRARK